MIVTVLIIRHVLKINVWTHANYPIHVERALYAKQLLIDQFVAAHLLGQETLITNVTNVRLSKNISKYRAQVIKILSK